MSATEETTGWVGAAVKRREDEPLLTGRGTFVDNMTPVGTAFMVVVRSPYAHARVTSVDLAPARAASSPPSRPRTSRTTGRPRCRVPGP
jgi:carbon-monoxide dehydrogenase large subunit